MGLFESLLDDYQEARHRRIFAGLFPRRRFSEVDGFLSPIDAAKVMGVSEEEVLEMAGRELLEWRYVRGTLEVRPGVVSVLAVQREAL